MPRTSLVISMRLAHSWNSKGWAPLAPSLRFGFVRRFGFARRGFIRRWLAVLLGALASAGVVRLDNASAVEPEAAVPAPVAVPAAAPAPAASAEPAASLAAPANEPASVVPDPAPAKVKLDHLSVEPAAVALSAADERVQLVVTAYSADGSMTDMTHNVEYCPADAKIARVDDGMVIPAGDGGVDIEVRATDPADGHQLTVRVPVKVQGYGVVRTVDFANDVEPLLSKFGCNSGGCHGKASGQNGFKLSLLGVDTALDYDALVKQGHGRRSLSGRSRPFAAVDQADRAVCPRWRQAVRRRLSSLSIAAALGRARDALGKARQPHRRADRRRAGRADHAPYV